MTTNLTTTNIGKESQKELKKLSQSWGMSQVEFLNHAIWYFKKTGINPNSPIFSPKEELAKLDKRLGQVIMFLRHQEKDKLTPLLDEIVIAERRLKESLALGVDKDDFNSLLIKILDLEEETKGQGENNKKYISHFFKEIQKVFEALLSEIENNRKEVAESKLHLNGLISLLFEALNNRSLSGKFSQDDIKKFRDAVY